MFLNSSYTFIEMTSSLLIKFLAALLRVFKSSCHNSSLTKFLILKSKIYFFSSTIILCLLENVKYVKILKIKKAKTVPVNNLDVHISLIFIIPSNLNYFINIIFD